MTPLQILQERAQFAEFTELVDLRFTGPHASTADVDDCTLRLVLRTHAASAAWCSRAPACRA